MIFFKHNQRRFANVFLQATLGQPSLALRAKHTTHRQRAFIVHHGSRGCMGNEQPILTKNKSKSNYRYAFSPLASGYLFFQAKRNGYNKIARQRQASIARTNVGSYNVKQRTHNKATLPMVPLHSRIKTSIKHNCLP